MVEDKIIWDVIAGRISFYALAVSNSLGLFEKLADDSKSMINLSVDLGLEERATEALVLMMLNLGFIKEEENKLSLTDVSRKYLLKNSETYFGDMIELSSNNNWTCEDLKKSALSNSPYIYGGEEVFESHNQDIEKCELFTKAMHSVSMSSALYWPSKVDLSKNKIFLDVGGGSGAHILGVLKKWNNLNAILLDLENVLIVAKKILKVYDVKSSVQFLAENFWECDYPESDIHFYSQIFHDWPEEKCKYLAKKSYDTLPKNGKIIIHEILFDEGKNGPLMASAGNVGMLAWTEGRQYSGKELSYILKSSGFKDIEIIPTFSYWSIVVGTK